VTRNDVVLKPIEPDPPARRVGIAVRDGDHHPLAVRSMIEILQGVGASRASLQQRGSLIDHKTPASDARGSKLADRFH
jgi:hypothetical protein